MHAQIVLVAILCALPPSQSDSSTTPSVTPSTPSTSSSSTPSVPSNSTPPALPKCVHIDPYDDVELWSAVNASGCDPLSPDESELTESERRRYMWGGEKFAYDVLASDKVGPKRVLEPMYHELCENISYTGLKLDVSVVIIYHNEALSVMVRMLNSIFDRTDGKILKEIILFDDYSDNDTLIQAYLIQYAKMADWPMQKVLMKRSDERLGLIRAKTYASRLASGDVLIFLDSHCEVSPLWVEPLIAPIQEDSTRAVLPVVDIIHPVNFAYSKAMVAKMAFDWALSFNWKYFPWEYFDVPENNIKPFKTPMMSGGLFAISRAYFREIGEYDTAMEIWGGENIELSVRLWLCGGSVLVAPCSRVGHVFRNRRPYGGKPGTDTNLFNTLRTVKVWFDDYQKYFFKERPKAVDLDAGDLSERIELKKRLNCKPFSYFVENIDPSLKPKEHEEL